MIRGGVPEKVATKISGHKTRSVFDRYNIVSEADVEDADLKIERGRVKTKKRTATRTATGVSAVITPTVRVAANVPSIQ
jgi:hypothetical protein